MSPTKKRLETKTSSELVGTNKKKCHTVSIAGSMTSIGEFCGTSKYFVLYLIIFISSGHSTSLSPRSCSNLLCLSCDFRVVFFDGFRWSGDDADYLFLRNNYPDFARMKAKLVPDQNARAYACGCSKMNPKEMTEVAKKTELKWACMKH
jgi:hypothetical protein